MATEKKERKVTPVGIAKWAHLDKPKEPYKGKGEPKYQIDIVFDSKDAGWQKWGKDLSDAIKKINGKQSPIKKELDSNDQPTGKYYATFKTSDKFQPRIFDKHGKLLEGVRIGNGSKVRVSYIENAYDSFGGGINLYLNAVQVLELVDFGNWTADNYGFEIEPEQGEDFPEPF